MIGPADQLEALSTELSVTPHSVLWGAACLLWAEPEHVAYAVLEAPSFAAVESYIAALTPAGWSMRALPVFALPNQLIAVREFLAAPASPFLQAEAPVVPLAEPPTPVEAPADEAPAAEPVSADTLEGLRVESPAETVADDQPTPQPSEPPVTLPTREPPDQPLERRVTREVPHVLQELPVAVPPPPPVTSAPTVLQPAWQEPVAPEPVAQPDQGPITDPGAVTRFIARPGILEAVASSPPTATPDQPAVGAGAQAPSESAAEPYSPSESQTVVLEPEAQRPAGLQLVASSGPAQGAVFEVGEAGATLGRLPENTICLTDGRLSRYHARIEFRDGGYWLSDLGSQNGTLVNDRPVTEAHRLQAGDSLQLGTSRLTVMLDADN